VPTARVHAISAAREQVSHQSTDALTGSIAVGRFGSETGTMPPPKWAVSDTAEMPVPPGASGLQSAGGAAKTGASTIRR